MTVNRDRLPLLFALASLCLLIAAVVMERFFDLTPCELCYLERWPHRAVVVLGLAVMLLPAGRARAWGTGVIAVALLVSAGIAGFHAGVEFGWWPGPESCTGPALTETDPAKLVDALMATQPVRCDEVQMRILGLSLAFWNMLISLALTVAAALGARWLAIGDPRHPDDRASPREA